MVPLVKLSTLVAMFAYAQHSTQEPTVKFTKMLAQITRA